MKPASEVVTASLLAADPVRDLFLSFRIADAHFDDGKLFVIRGHSDCPRRLHREFFRETSDRHKPSKLIKNQNTSTINADKLKAKMSETIISSAPPALSSEYFGDELGSLSSCRSK